KHLGEGKGNRRARRGTRLEAHPSDHVLAHIKEKSSARPAAHFGGWANRLKFLDAAHRRPIGGDQGHARIVENFYLPPCFVIEAGAIPAGLLAAGVVGLPPPHVAPPHPADAVLPPASPNHPP